ncbi:MAG TPA: hypothetical protein VHN99_07920 [Deinococcales bacterium]|nr:hypothetical protein [Deinococcales bacterium]
MGSQKGILTEPAATWADVPTLESGNSGSPYPKTPVKGASRDAGNNITDLGDDNEQAQALAARTNYLKAGMQSYTPNATLTPAATGTLAQLLGFFARLFKAITGGTNWYDLPSVTLAGLNSAKADAAAVTTALAGKAPTSHTHPTSEIVGYVAPTPYTREQYTAVLPNDVSFPSVGSRFDIITIPPPPGQRVVLKGVRGVMGQAEIRVAQGNAAGTVLATYPSDGAVYTPDYVGPLNTALCIFFCVTGGASAASQGNALWVEVAYQ